MDTMIRGTTPTVEFTFNTVDVGDIVEAILSIKQLGQTIVEKDMSSCTVEEASISWLLSQKDTLSLDSDYEATMICDWVLESGIRGASKECIVSVKDAGKNKVIEWTPIPK